MSVDVVDGQTFTVDENALDGTVVGTPVVTQTTSDSLTYSITAGNDSQAFLIHPVSGEIRVADGSKLDYETQRVYDLTVQASAGVPGESDSSVVRVLLNNVSGAAALSISGAATLSAVGDRITLADGGGTVIYSTSRQDVTSLTINGSAGSDTLTIDFSGDNPLPDGGLTFDGMGQPVGGADGLELLGGTFEKVEYRFDNGHDGGLTFTSGGTTSTIEYFGLEPIVNTGTADEIVLTLSSANDNAVLEQISAGPLRLRSTDASPTFESTTFAAPTTSLTIVAGDGDDTITVTPIEDDFALTIEGGGQADTLIIDQVDAPVAAPVFTFAGFGFLQSATPDKAERLAGSLEDGTFIGALIGGTIGVSGFPDSAAGFDEDFSIGRLLNPGLTAGTLGVNMPASNIGTVDRCGFRVWWDGGLTLSEQDGDDFVIYESGDAGEPDAAMVQVYIVGRGWSDWRYEAPDSFAPYGGTGNAGTFATAYNLADFGVQAGESIREIRYVNMTAADRMVGPGAERVTGSGVFVASGFVIPDDGGLTSQVLPDPGTMATFAYYGNATFDPDPLYIGALHALGSSGGADNPDDVTVDSTTITTARGGADQPEITYSGFGELEINTRGGIDSVSIDVEAGLPAQIRVDQGSPNSSDVLTIYGTTGGQTFTLTGGTISDGAMTIEVAGVETVTIDVMAAGTGDTVKVDRSFALSGIAPKLQVYGGGTFDNDKLQVDTEYPTPTIGGAETFTFAGVTFNETSTPDLLSELGEGTLVGGQGVVITTRPLSSGPSTPMTGFPTSTVGFNAALSLGALWANSSPTTARYVNLPDGTNNGTAARAGLALGWSDGRSMVNGVGSDFVIYESGDDGGGPDAYMVQVHNAETGEWSDWVYKKATSSQSYGAASAFATEFDIFDDFEVTGPVDAVRIANLTAADTVDDVSGQGKVVIGGGPGTFVPLDPSNNPFTATGYDPDLLYFGVRHDLGTVTARDDVVNVDPNSVDVDNFIGVEYDGLMQLEVDTGGGADVITVTPCAFTEYTIRGGSPDFGTNPGDRLTFDLSGVADPEFRSTGVGAGTLAASNRAEVRVEGIDSLSATSPMNVVVNEAANSTGGSIDEFSIVRNGASNQISVNGQLVLRVDRDVVQTLFVDGSDGADDRLTVNFSVGSPVPTGGTIEFTGGAGGDDLLQFTGGTVTTVVQNYDNVTDGNTDVDGDVVTYFGVESITDDLTAANRNFVYLDDDDVIDFGDDVTPIYGVGRSQISSDHGALTRFKNPTATMLLEAGDGDDTITLDRLDGAFAATVTFNGRDGDDDFALDDNGRGVDGGQVDWIRFPLAIDGGGQEGDTLTIDDTGSTTDKTYTVSNVQIGGSGVPTGAAVSIPGVTITVDGTDITDWSQIPVTFDTGARPASASQTILHFNFAADGGSYTADSANNNTGLLVEPPGPQFRVSAGKFDGALEFDGVDDYAWFQDAAFNVGERGTLNFWVQMDNTARRNQMFEGPGDSGFEFQYREQTSAGGQFYGRTTSNGDFVIRSGGDNSAAGVWTNLQYTWDFATKEMHIYRDGVESSYFSTGTTPTTMFTPYDLVWTTITNTVNGMMNVGRDPGTPGREFDGKMDDIAWFDEVLTPTERDALRNVGVQAAQNDVGGVNSTGRLSAVGSNLNAALVAFWSLDDAPGTTDIAGDGGTSIILHTIPKPTATFVGTGKFGGALDFNGTDNYATFQDPTFDVGAQGTLSFWVAVDATGRRNQFFEGPGGSSFEFQWNNGNVFARANSGGDTVIQTGGTPGTPGTWINYQYTWDFNTKVMTIYRNGTQVATKAVVGWNSVVSTVNQVIQVGRDTGTAGRALDGRMDDVAWFNKVLTATERNALLTQSVGTVQGLTGGGQANASGVFNSTTDDPTNGRLVAYWSFDNPTGTLIAGDGGTKVAMLLGPQAEGAQFVAGGGPVPPGAVAPLNAIAFDGDRDSIRVADSASLDFDKTQGTISFWVRPDLLTADNNPSTGFVTLVEDSNRQIFVGVSRQQSSANGDLFGRLVFSPYQNTPASNQNIIVSNTRLVAAPDADPNTPGQWTHVTVTWDYSSPATPTAAIYINGVLDAPFINNTTSPTNWPQIADNTGDWIFGADGTTQGHALTGRMADIAVYGTALRASEVASLYQTGAADSGSFDLAGARGRFTWDDDYIYGLVESYAPPVSGTENGPFDNLVLKLYVNDDPNIAVTLDASVLLPVNNIAGSDVQLNGDDVDYYEFRIPISAIVGSPAIGSIQFDPTAGHYLRYQLTTIDGDVPGSGFDTSETTLGWIVEPQQTPDGLRRLDFARSENFFGVGGRLTYGNVAHLEINGGSGVDNLTVVDSLLAPPATNPTHTFKLNTGDGDDEVTIASVDQAFNAAVTIDGQGGDDTVTIDAELNLGSLVSTGALEITAESINLNAKITTTDGGTGGDVSLHVGTLLTIDAAADIEAGGDVLIDGAGETETAGDVTTLGGNITVETATTLTGDVSFDSVGGNIEFGTSATLDGAQNLTLDAGAALADGDITFNAEVGGSDELVDVVVIAARHLTLNEDFSAESLTHDAGSGTLTIEKELNLTESVDPAALVVNTPEVVIRGDVRSDVAAIQITTDAIDLDTTGTLTVTATASTGRIELVTRTDDVELELGDDTSGRLSLNADELERITVDVFQFGDADAGELFVAGAVEATNIGEFHIITGAGVTSTPGAGTIDAARLAVEAEEDVDLANENDVDFLAIWTGAGSEISYRDADGFTLSGGIDGINGISSSGDVTLEAGGLIDQEAVTFTSPGGGISAAGLQLLGDSAELMELNNVETLAADLDGTLQFFDVNDLKIGTVETFGRTSTEGVTTADADAWLAAAQTISLEDPVDVGAATLVLYSDFAAIDDVGSVETKVFANSLALRAATGIGTTQALRTEVKTLAARNVTSGGVAIDDRSGTDLSIGSVPLPFGVPVSISGIDNDGLGGISVVHMGPMSVDALVSAQGGPLSLSTTAGSGDLSVDARIELLTGASDINLFGGLDLLINNSVVGNEIQSNSTGNIIGSAGSNVFIGPNVRIQSFSGAITNIPPLLQNVSGPQIANTGDASVTFDYGRLLEFNFTALVNWSDGIADLLGLVTPGNSTTTATHVYTGNPNLADPAAPITVTVTLRSDSRIRFTGYETTTASIELDFPGDGVRNVRIDTTVKVRYLTAAPPERIVAEIIRQALSQQQNNVYGAGSAEQEAAGSAERVVILREVLPDGTEGSAVRFDQAALDDLPEVFKKVRNGRYRVYVFDPGTQSLRMLMEIYVEEGKPTTPDAGESQTDGSSASLESGSNAPLADAMIDETAPVGDGAEEPVEADSRTSARSTAAAAVVGAGLVVAGGSRNWTERVDAALARFGKFSRLRGKAPRRKFPR